MTTSSQILLAAAVMVGLTGCVRPEPDTFQVYHGCYPHRVIYANKEVGHQWQSHIDGGVCGTTTPEGDGEWGFNQLGTDIGHIEFDTEKEAFDFGSRWCQP